MKNEFRVINRTTREEQVFNSKELKRFFHCEYDPQTQKVKYNNEHKDYAISCFGLALIILVTEIVMKWI